METARILVVDEPKHFQTAIDGMLEKAEYATVLSSGGHDAIAHIEQDPPYDLILADLVMAEWTEPVCWSGCAGYNRILPW